MSEPIDLVESLRKLVASHLYEVNTSIPGKIVSYSNGRAKVQPTPKKRFPDGDVLDFPILQNARVCWPSFAGGSAGVKGPIRPGDNCLIVFSQQAVDGSDDPRRFDITDAYVIPCDLGAAVGESQNNDGMTLFFGGAFIRITESGGMVVNAPGGTSWNGGINQSGGAMVSNGITVHTHLHGGVLPGPLNTSMPI